MSAGFLITFREGLEAFLVVGIILSYLARCNMLRYGKWVFLGVIMGLVSAFSLGLLFQIYYNGFESSIGELYLKIGIMGFAVVVLTYMVVWMTRNCRNVKGEIEKNLERAVSTGNLLALVFMSYLAILREGFETVLFLGAMFGNEMTAPVFYGGALGLFISLTVTIAIFKGMRKAPIKQFFKITGALIMVIAGGLLINMIGIMQDINMLPVFQPALFDLSWLLKDSSETGIFCKALFGYTHDPTLMQVIVYFSYFIVITLILTPREKLFQSKEVVRA